MAANHQVTHVLGIAQVGTTADLEHTVTHFQAARTSLGIRLPYRLSHLVETHVIASETFGKHLDADLRFLAPDH